jgi:hypothetical protein
MDRRSSIGRTQRGFPGVNCAAGLGNIEVSGRVEDAWVPPPGCATRPDRFVQLPTPPAQATAAAAVGGAGAEVSARQGGHAELDAPCAVARTPAQANPNKPFPIRRMTPAERNRGSEWELRGGSPRRDLVRRPHRGGTSARRRRCRCLSHPVRRRGWWRGRTLATRLSERVRGSSRAGVRSSHPGRAVG